MRHFSLLVLLFAGTLHAQLIDQQVREETMLIDGISTTVQKARVVGQVDEFRSLWRDFLKDEFGIKTSRKGDVIIAEEVVVNRITDRRGDLILFMYPQEKEVNFNIAFRLGYDVYLNSDEFPEEATNLRDFAVYFINYYYYHYLEDYIKMQEKNLGNLQKELKTAVKTIQKSEKSVEKMEKKLSRNDKKTERLQESLETSPEEEKEGILSEITSIRMENTALRQEISEVKAPVEKNEELIKVLEPKIAKLEETLDRNRLMYIEARDRIKR